MSFYPHASKLHMTSTFVKIAQWCKQPVLPEASNWASFSWLKSSSKMHRFPLHLFCLAALRFLPWHALCSYAGNSSFLSGSFLTAAGGNIIISITLIYLNICLQPWASSLLSKFHLTLCFQLKEDIKHVGISFISSINVHIMKMVWGSIYIWHLTCLLSACQQYKVASTASFGAQVLSYATILTRSTLISY